MSKHTPTPWVYIPEHEDGEGSAIIGADGYFVAKTHTGLGDIHHVNGNHIVHCVNSYEAMREALAELLAALEAEWKATVEFLQNPKRDEYRAAMHDHKARRMRAESHARDLLAKLREAT